MYEQMYGTDRAPGLETALPMMLGPEGKFFGRSRICKVTKIAPEGEKMAASAAQSGQKGLRVGESDHHVPAVRKSVGRPFEVGRADKARPTIHSRAADEAGKAHDHWRMHNAERQYVGPRTGDFVGTDEELIQAYKKPIKGSMTYALTSGHPMAHFC